MKSKWIICILIFIWIVAVVYALSEQSHEFADHQCTLCHYDEKNEPENIKPTITLACNSCHSKIKQEQSHPTDIYPTLSIPKDMPLIEGRLTCITCHYVHSKKNMLFTKKHSFLRRLSKGIFFCMTCHKVDKNKHIVIENIHPGTYRVTNRKTRIDNISLTCIECHDSYIDSIVTSLGAGTWNHYKKEFNHPIGVSYDRISKREIRNFRPSSMLSKEMKLYNGKIGCGTCHSIYSKERFMLVIDNRRSRLCLECHIK